MFFTGKKKIWRLWRYKNEDELADEAKVWLFSLRFLHNIPNIKHSFWDRKTWVEKKNMTGETTWKFPSNFQLPPGGFKCNLHIARLPRNCTVADFFLWQATEPRGRGHRKFKRTEAIFAPKQAGCLSEATKKSSRLLGFLLTKGSIPKQRSCLSHNRCKNKVGSAAGLAALKIFPSFWQWIILSVAFSLSPEN